jgi:hypothetical protein
VSTGRQGQRSSSGADAQPADHRSDKPSGLVVWALVAASLITLAWLLGRQHYYDWILGRETIAVTVFCDATVFGDEAPQVWALYDKVALSPIAIVLGALQNRAPDQVRSYHLVRISEPNIAAHALHLPSVPSGPLARILVRTRGRRYYVDIRDQTVRDGTIYVHLPRRLRGNAPAL